MDKTPGDVWPFRGFCLGVPKQQDLGMFERLIAEELPRHGCNTLVLLIRYQYQFQSHPEVGDSQSLTPAQASRIAALCRQNGIRLIPKMNLLGHQSGREQGSELGLLRAYPDLDETPDLPQVRYCRSLCPRHPQVQPIVFDLADELLDAFQADALHVGLDEVFEIGRCPRCRGMPNGELFAGWVQALHDHLVGRRGVEMLMWGDRLLDAGTTGYGEWEASANQTWMGIDRIPRDIVICDWHYEERAGYPSIPFFVARGFRMVVCPWKNASAAEMLIRDAAAQRTERLLGVLATSWCDSGAVARYLCGDPSVESTLGVENTPGLVGKVFKQAMDLARGATLNHS